MSNLIPSGSVIHSCHITTYLQVLEIREWTTLGEHYSPYHKIDIFQSLHLAYETKKAHISKKTSPVSVIEVLKITLFFILLLKSNNQIMSNWYM